MEFEGEIVYETDKPNSQPCRCLDAQRDRKAFGFNAQMDFQPGMIETVEG
jgi:GDP-L-fucose synthase